MPVPAWPASSDPGVRAAMRSNRRVDTKPEVALRSLLHRAGLRFRKDYRLDLPLARVRPDIVFTRVKVAVFVDGCFWHCCPEHAVSPKSNDWYWAPKLARNVERDRRADEALGSAGWHVVRIWEHEPIDEAMTRLLAIIEERRHELAEASPARDGGA
jgi:DNA mismatch endonuclease (patch repair protein)